MKKLYTIIALMFVITISKAQTSDADVIYLKNGSIIKGTIIEQIPNESIKLKTKDGNIFVFKMDELTKMTKESEVTSKKDSLGSNKTSTRKYLKSKYLTSNYFGVYLGGSIPRGIYAQFNNNATDGFAKSGFFINLKGNQNLIKVLGFGYSLGFNYNAFNEDKYRQHIDDATSNSMSVSFKSDPYYSFHAFIGPVLKIPIVDVLIFEFSPEMGMFGAVRPTQSITYSDPTTGNIIQEYDLSSVTKLGFGFQIDAGLRIIINDKLCVKLGYNYINSNNNFNQDYTITKYTSQSLNLGNTNLPSKDIQYRFSNPYFGFLFQF